MGRSAASPSAACAAMMRAAAWSNESSTSSQCGRMSGPFGVAEGDCCPRFVVVPLVMEIRPVGGRVHWSAARSNGEGR